VSREEAEARGGGEGRGTEGEEEGDEGAKPLISQIGGKQQQKRRMIERASERAREREREREKERERRRSAKEQTLHQSTRRKGTAFGKQNWGPQVKHRRRKGKNIYSKHQQTIGAPHGNEVTTQMNWPQVLRSIRI